MNILVVLVVSSTLNTAPAASPIYEFFTEYPEVLPAPLVSPVTPLIHDGLDIMPPSADSNPVVKQKKRKFSEKHPRIYKCARVTRSACLFVKPLADVTLDVVLIAAGLLR